jgi:hypothetical protein
MYSYFYLSGLTSVKAISVHRAHRLLSESTLILCTLHFRNLLIVGSETAPHRARSPPAAFLWIDSHDAWDHSSY